VEHLPDLEFGSPHSRFPSRPSACSPWPITSISRRPVPSCNEEAFCQLSNSSYNEPRSEPEAARHFCSGEKEVVERACRYLVDERLACLAQVVDPAAENRSADKVFEQRANYLLGELGGGGIGLPNNGRL
jgi:hypothetical protein